MPATDSGRAEAARQLLADTEGVAGADVSKLGKLLPLLAAVLVLVLGLVVPAFGAADKVELTRQLRRGAESMEETTQRSQVLFGATCILPRACTSSATLDMAEERPADAAKMFEWAATFSPGVSWNCSASWSRRNRRRSGREDPGADGRSTEGRSKEETNALACWYCCVPGRALSGAIDYWNRSAAQLLLYDNPRWRRKAGSMCRRVSGSQRRQSRRGTGSR
ncbi:hypothetical protein ACXX9E_28850 [Pseudomonas sp. GNP014]